MILVSFDGFRWDYPEIYNTTNFDRMEKDGVRAERVISSFPTKTFPNHYSIATGLYPDHHGIIANNFYASDLELEYSIGNRGMVENAEFYLGEPIWNTASKQNVLSASFFWVGSEAAVQGIQPTYWKPYDGSIPFDARIDTVIHWLSLPPAERPRLVLLYFQEPDGIGHRYGPIHDKTGKTVEELDQLLGLLRSKLDELPFSKRINLIVTSDHGMGAINPDRYVNIMEHLEESWIKKIYGGNPFLLIDAEDEYIDSVVVALNQAEGINAWHKEEIPSRLNYGMNPRISEVVAVADSSWSLGISFESGDYSGGAHGYDNRNTDMHNIFYASGPAFKKGISFPPFRNVDIYPLIAYILDLDPAETDGSLENVIGMLK